MFIIIIIIIRYLKLFLSHHESYSILEKDMYKALDKTKPCDTFLPQIDYSARVLYKTRLHSWNTQCSQKVTRVCTNPISVYHILLECPIKTALFKKDGYMTYFM